MGFAYKLPDVYLFIFHQPVVSANVLRAWDMVTVNFEVVISFVSFASASSLQEKFLQ